MGWPEYTYITLTVLGGIVTIFKDEPLYMKIAAFIATGGIYGLLFAGGFFK
jgi:hypothetical protein